MRLQMCEAVRPVIVNAEDCTQFVKRYLGNIHMCTDRPDMIAKLGFQIVERNLSVLYEWIPLGCFETVPRTS